MNHPEQAGIFRDGFRHFHALEYRLREHVGRGALVGALRAALAPDSDQVVTVVAFGPSCLAHLDDAAPAFGAFHAIHGRDGFVMPATQRDVLFWLQGSDSDVLFDAVRRIDAAMAAVAVAELDLPGFTYHDSRDLTGFVDGIGNPTGRAARNAALVPQGQPGAGGSYVLTQRWHHDLAAFGALPVHEQEMIMGRTRADAVELDEASMPHDAHVARTDFTQDGEAMKMWRRSMPFGTAREHGLLFLAFCCRLGRFDVLLRRMAGDWEDGVRDRLTDFSVPVSGSYWYAPPRAWLAALLAA
jgi:putative iron-dependent peroxidase